MATDNNIYSLHVSGVELLGFLEERESWMTVHNILQMEILRSERS
jgi:hypothetical protein